MNQRDRVFHVVDFPVAPRFHEARGLGVEEGYDDVLELT